MTRWDELMNILCRDVLRLPSFYLRVAQETHHRSTYRAMRNALDLFPARQQCPSVSVSAPQSSIYRETDTDKYSTDPDDDELERVLGRSDRRLSFSY
jgi:hypothetical protein